MAKTTVSPDTRDQKKPMPVCGIVMPIAAWAEHSATHWTEVKEILERAIGAADLEARPVWQSTATDIIQGRIVRNLYECDIAVCDISGLNPNVMFELGMRLTFRKPTVIVADDKTRLPFDTNVIDTIIYPSDLHFKKIENFIVDLSSRFSDVLAASDAGDFKPYLDIFGTFQVVEPPSDHVPFADHLQETLDMIQLNIQKIQSRIDYIDSESTWKNRGDNFINLSKEYPEKNINSDKSFRKVAYRRNYSYSDIKKLDELMKSGKTINEISKEIQISPGRISEIIRNTNQEDQ
ncbi:hypothetical protein [Novosphingobium sp. KACC 22771]|uniref:hypothetical protein n=1 Tax=Novosphingobium sp. KACC 22771 TaxID=3025670 RepID=UPI002366CB3C|nr:hypothetical protein [Novosphingobium sp. KACC 22771]WDF73677.1 hypothetical protein PQ467_06450 [Novosphingobium sp. KACC 22771]